MKVQEYWFNNGQYRFRVREWNCCGHLWQLLLSRRFPERYVWKPTCPTCGKKGMIPGDRNVNNIIN
jgi:hypothetical protein